MKDTHTHRGHCPACGAVHAVSTNETLVAKHGYNTHWGYFDNICDGADHTPLELDKTFTEKFIGKLEDYIVKTEKEIEAFTGVKGVTCLFRTEYDSEKEERIVNAIKKIPTRYDPGWHLPNWDEKYEYIPNDKIEEITKDLYCDHRAGSTENIIERANKMWLYDKKSSVKGAKEHIEFLKGLIEKIYGNPLINVADGGKILKDMETEVSEGFDEHEIVGNYGRKKYFAGYEKSITKSVSIGDITLKIMRGNTYRNEGDTYRCYFFLNDEKIAKKKLLEKLGGG